MDHQAQQQREHEKINRLVSALIQVTTTSIRLNSVEAGADALPPHIIPIASIIAGIMIELTPTQQQQFAVALDRRRRQLPIQGA